MLRQTRTALDETGVKFLDLELARIIPDVDPKTYLPAMEAAAELGACHVISSVWTPDTDDRNFIVERYAEICELAAPLGLTVDLEFPTISRLTNLPTTVDIVRAAGCPNSGILLDTLYIHFSGASLDELSALPRDWIHFLHICDTSEEIPRNRGDMTHIIRDDRLYLRAARRLRGGARHLLGRRVSG